MNKTGKLVLKAFKGARRSAVFLFLVSTLQPHAFAANRMNEGKLRQSEKTYFNPQRAPTNKEWILFNDAPEKTRAELWAREPNLAHWQWQWRIGWIRHCQKPGQDHCDNIFKQALNDKALVVRSSAAAQMGQMYIGTKNPEVVELLKKAANDPRNNRNGKPLFIQQRIIYSLVQVGGSDAQSTATQIASKDAVLKEYHRKLDQAKL